MVRGFPRIPSHRGRDCGIGAADVARDVVVAVYSVERREATVVFQDLNGG